MEMNLHAPNSVETETELRMLSSVQNHIISNQSNKPNIVIVQDGLLGAYVLTKYDEQIPYHHFLNMIQCIHNHQSLLPEKIKKFDEKCKHLPLYSGKCLFSFLLPPNMFYKHNDVIIEDGILINGIITKTQLGSSHHSLISLFYHTYGSARCEQFINEVQFLSNAFLFMHGFTVSIQDCIIPESTKQDIHYGMEKKFLEAMLSSESIMTPHLQEMTISNILNNARNSAMKIAKESLPHTNNFLSTVTSGAKGDYFNITQIMAMLGQQNFQGQRIQPTLSGNRRTLPHFKYIHDIKDASTRFRSQGFIQNSFLKGLDPTEFWFHAITGREGITDTAMKTATSGYIQRRMVKVAEDVQVKYDNTVRNSAGSILQFRYGYHSYDPSQSIIVNDEKKNPTMFFADVGNIINQLNHEHST